MFSQSRLGKLRAGAAIHVQSAAAFIGKTPWSFRLIELGRRRASKLERQKLEELFGRKDIFDADGYAIREGGRQ